MAGTGEVRDVDPDTVKDPPALCADEATGDVAIGEAAADASGDAACDAGDTADSALGEATGEATGDASADTGSDTALCVGDATGDVDRDAADSAFGEVTSKPPTTATSADATDDSCL